LPLRSYLYVILDIFSRGVVGWCVADAESAALFKPLFDACPCGGGGRGDTMFLLADPRVKPVGKPRRDPIA
jgi:hypothetical protein